LNDFRKHRCPWTGTVCSFILLKYVHIDVLMKYVMNLKLTKFELHWKQQGFRVIDTTKRLL
jgi:hypothetical protein